jgi:hypothetical protein
MIDNTVKQKTAMLDEFELIREPFMDHKKKEDWSAEETQKYLDYLRKEKDIQEKKEKIRSQNLTKLNNYKIELETLKMSLDSKFLNIFKRKIYYDYRIWEQELYILTLLRGLNVRQDLAKSKAAKLDEYNKIKEKENLWSIYLDNFKNAYGQFNIRNTEVVTSFQDKFKNKNIENKNFYDSSMLEFTQEEKGGLLKIRADPFYFFEKDELKKAKRGEEKRYKEIRIPNKDEVVNLLNQKFYFEYKQQQINDHLRYLNNEFDGIYESAKATESEYIGLEEEFKKAKLNLEILVKIKKAQDEITDEQGPQAYIDDCILMESFEIEELNKNINNQYGKKLRNESKSKNHLDIENYEKLEYQRIRLIIHEIKLKSRYLKLTRVTKKIQEIVTDKTEKMNSGTLIKPEVENEKLSVIYEEKKKSLAQNKLKREEAMLEKLKLIRKELEKKKRDNQDFNVKIQKLEENVALKTQIMNLDKDEPWEDIHTKSTKT